MRYNGSGITTLERCLKFVKQFLWAILGSKIDPCDRPIRLLGVVGMRHMLYIARYTPIACDHINTLILNKRTNNQQVQ